ncbi:MAG: alpha/beta fold hydrolase [Anaerolineae bacterium]|nr:alpha/beta fold hydrolase [Anaerolineae bacterium]
MRGYVNDINLYYEDKGQRDAVLLVHGFPLNCTIWTPQVRALAPQYRVILPDLRGHGRSDAPPGPYTMDLYADDLAALLDHLQVRRVVLGGLSMGGYIAFAFYRKYAGRVRALILADTRAGADTPEGRERREAGARLAEREGSAAIAAQMLPNLLSPRTRERRQALVARVQSMMARTKPVGIAGAQRGMALRPDSSPLLAGIDVPVLILVGEDDIITPPAEAEQMAAAIPGARLVKVPHAGHISTLENARAVNRALLSFLAGLHRP